MSTKYHKLEVFNGANHVGGLTCAEGYGFVMGGGDADFYESAIRSACSGLEHDGKSLRTWDPEFIPVLADRIKSQYPTHTVRVSEFIEEDYDE